MTVATSSMNELTICSKSVEWIWSVNCHYWWPRHLQPAIHDSPWTRSTSLKEIICSAWVNHFLNRISTFSPAVLYNMDVPFVSDFSIFFSYNIVLTTQVAQGQLLSPVFFGICDHKVGDLIPFHGSKYHKIFL